jgi:HSP90 family molecular chaperone
MLRALPARLSKVRATGRLRASPCVVTDHESASLRRMMRMVEAGSAGSGGGGSGSNDAQPRMEAHMLPKQVLEVNPAHAVIVRLHAIRDAQPELARAVAEQLLDNALIAAGLVDDSRTMLPRLAGLLERVLGVPVTPTAAAAAPPRRVVGEEAIEAGERLNAKLEEDARGGVTA